jgi:dienelactone hydrolase
MLELIGFGMKHLGDLIQDKDLLNSQLIQGWCWGGRVAWHFT